MPLKRGSNKTLKGVQKKDFFFLPIFERKDGRLKENQLCNLWVCTPTLSDEIAACQSRQLYVVKSLINTLKMRYDSNMPVRSLIYFNLLKM